MVNSEVQERQLRIGELAQRGKVTVRTIRYYEELGLLKSCPRGQAKHRRYSEKDLLYLHRIQQLKTYGLTLSEIKEIVDLANVDPSGEKRRRKLLSRYLEKYREALVRKQKLEEYLAELEWHIDQLQKVHNFQACPGEECQDCAYTGICRLAKTQQEVHS
jgi:DNA-binding transcriptional MerR regulator